MKRKNETIIEFLNRNVDTTDIIDAHRTCETIGKSARDQAIRLALSGYSTQVLKYLTIALTSIPPELEESEAIGLLTCAETVRLVNDRSTGFGNPKELAQSERDILRVSRLWTTPRS